jgi:hypothetical protein
MSLTPLFVPPPRRAPGEPYRRPEKKSVVEPPVSGLHRHQAAVIDVERPKLNEERAQPACEKEEFERRRQQFVAHQEQLALAPKPNPEEGTYPVHAPATYVAPIHKPDVVPTDRKALARRIIEMGEVRRGERPYRGTEPTIPLAKMILRAADKARSIAPPPELPEHPLARAIVLCGLKARNSIDATGERWLADYFARAEAIRGLMQ